MRGDRALRWAGRAGWIILGLQLAGMITFSLIELRNFDLTGDSASYYQGLYLISHGHFDAFSSTLGFPFWRNNGEFICWPLAFLFRPFLSPATFLISGDLFMMGSGAVGLIWVLDLVRRPSWPARFPPWIAVSSYALLAALNPWVYITIAFAWHLEPLDVFLLMLAAYFIEHRRWKMAAVFVGLNMLTGSTGAVLLSCLGLATLLGGRRWRRPGIIVLIIGLATVFFLASLKPKGGNIGITYGYVLGAVRATSGNYPSVTQILKGVAEHPDRVLGALWTNRLNIYAILGPSGIIGLFSPWGFGVPAGSLLISEAAHGQALGSPSFQNAGAYPFLTLGTIFVLRRIALVRQSVLGHRVSVLGRLPRHLPAALSGVVTVNALLWGAVWLPQLPGEWFRISSPTAAVLRRVAAVIPPNAQVLASPGILGSFAQRQWIYNFFPGARYPIKARSVYFVVTPNQGIESAQVSNALSAISYLAEGLHATPVAHAEGAWAFRWDPPRGMRSFRLRVNSVALPAWTAAGAAGKDVFVGKPADWLVGSDGRAGYVVSGDYWRRGVGRYRADVRLSTNVPVNVEVWNETSNTLLARRSVPASEGLQDVSFGVDVVHLAPVPTLHGSGPFSILPIRPAPGNSLEIRVWTSGGGGVSVYRLGLRET